MRSFTTLSAWRHVAQAYGEGSYDSGTYNNTDLPKPATESTTSYPSATNTPSAPVQHPPSSSTSSDSSAHTQTTPSQASIADATPITSSPDPLWAIALFIAIAVVVGGAGVLIKNKPPRQ